MNDPIETPIHAAEQADNNNELAELEAQEKELAAAAAALAAKKAAVQQRAQAPRDPHALGLKARDAIVEMLAHRNGSNPAADPETRAWQAMGAFFESLGN